MSDLERYLRRATRGLWGRRRAEVRAELEEHALARAHALELGGLPTHEALSRALTELGRPEAVSVGMNGVHMMPNVAHWAPRVVVAIALITLKYAPGAAQVIVTSQGVVPPCLEERARLTSGERLRVRHPNAGCSLSRDQWLRLSSLRPLGVRVERVPAGVELTFPGDGPVLVAVDAQGGVGGRAYAESFVRDGSTYLSLRSLVRRLAEGSRLPVTLQGWASLRLSVGQASFDLGPTDRPVEAVELYLTAVAGRLLDALEITGPSSRSVSLPRGFVGRNHRHVLPTTSAQPDSVYGLLTLDAQGRPSLDLAPALGSEVELYTLWPRLEFVRDLKALSPQSTDGRVKAALLRLTGRIDSRAPTFEVVVPVVPTSDAAR